MIGLGIVAGLFEATAATFFKGMPSFVHPIVPLLAYLVVVDRPTSALFLGASAGIIIDVLAPEHPTFALGRYLLIAVIIALAARRLFTNQSLYAALALTLIARVLDVCWQIVARWLTGRFPFSLTAAAAWHDAWRVAVTDVLLVGAGFVVGAFVVKRFVVGRKTSVRPYG